MGRRGLGWEVGEGEASRGRTKGWHRSVPGWENAPGTGSEGGPDTRARRDGVIRGGASGIVVVEGKVREEVRREGEAGRGLQVWMGRRGLGWKVGEGEASRGRAKGGHKSVLGWENRRERGAGAGLVGHGGADVGWEWGRGGEGPGGIGDGQKWVSVEWCPRREAPGTDSEGGLDARARRDRVVWGGAAGIVIVEGKVCARSGH